MLPFPWVFVMKSSYTDIFDMLNRYRADCPSLYILYLYIFCSLCTLFPIWQWCMYFCFFLHLAFGYCNTPAHFCPITNLMIYSLIKVFN